MICWKRSCSFGDLEDARRPATCRKDVQAVQAVRSRAVALFERIEPEANPNAVRVLVVFAEPVARRTNVVVANVGAKLCCTPLPVRTTLS